ncbi:MAG TPA: DUF2510 domain-containing protein [Ilumatobacter sp.]|nr:DUF2510 domain-containing protein [Ilumatobacter sp.]
MQEFSSIAVSSYEAESLSDRLTEQSAAGWSVVAVVPAGSQVVAYLSRSASGAVTPAAADISSDVAPDLPVTEVAAVADVTIDEPTVADPVQDAPGWAVTPDAASTVDTTSSPTPSPTPDPAPEVTAPAAAAAPAGWYADPAARYDLRYWDGSDWTEHVSRNGQQSTDPPVA